MPAGPVAALAACFRDAENAGTQEIADFFRSVMEQDAARAHQCHEFLARLGGTDNTAPQG